MLLFLFCVVAMVVATATSEITSEIYCPYTGRRERCTAADVPGAASVTTATVKTAPDAFDWNSVNGTLLVTADLNQHIPVYCGSCWAHAAASTIADRIKIGRHRAGAAALTVPGHSRDVLPAIQAVINCGDAGSCHGGDTLAMFAWINKAGGVPDVTCQAYEARNVYNASSPECASGFALCRTCRFKLAPGHEPPYETYCEPVHPYPRIEVIAYGHLPTEKAIVAELLTHGPLTCHINSRCLEAPRATRSATGIFDYECAGHNHAVQLAGWGVDDGGARYWTLRNSWGTYWGDHGWFRIRRDAPRHWRPDEFGCNWVTPKLPVAAAAAAA